MCDGMDTVSVGNLSYLDEVGWTGSASPCRIEYLTRNLHLKTRACIFAGTYGLEARVWHDRVFRFAFVGEILKHLRHERTRKLIGKRDGFRSR